MNLYVQVTEKHIERGKRKSTDFCPIGLALNETAPEFRHDVYDNRIYVHNADDFYVAVTPKVAREFIGRFDAKERVEPIEFKLVFTDIKQMFGDKEYE